MPLIRCYLLSDHRSIDGHFTLLLKIHPIPQQSFTITETIIKEISEVAKCPKSHVDTPGEIWFLLIWWRIAEYCKYLFGEKITYNPLIAPLVSPPHFRKWKHSCNWKKHVEVIQFDCDNIHNVTQLLVKQQEWKLYLWPEFFLVHGLCLLC